MCVCVWGGGGGGGGGGYRLGEDNNRITRKASSAQVLINIYFLHWIMDNIHVVISMRATCL